MLFSPEVSFAIPMVMTVLANREAMNHAAKQQRLRDAAMRSARGYKRISQKPEEIGQLERWVCLIQKSVKRARKCNHVALSMTRFRGA